MTRARIAAWHRERRPYWWRILFANVVAAFVVLFVFLGATWSTPLNQLARGFGISMIFSMCTGPLLGILMPRIAPWVWQRIGFPLNWIAISAAMAVFAIIGTLIAVAVLVAIGIVAPRDYFAWFRGSLRIAIAISLTIGLFITAYEVMRARVAHATTAAQLAALESRVQPHFLFNTLNSIAALIHEDPQRAERMTGQLASLLRASLDQQATPLVSLEDELRTVRDYLAIEHVRFGDRLRYSIHVDANTDGARLPRLALQTLVENSVKYAVSPRREGGTITVRVTGTKAPPGVTTRTVSVEDDGPGFDASALPAGHGLALLRDRLALLFGGTVPLTIESRPGATRVALAVPEIHDKPSITTRPATNKTNHQAHKDHKEL